MKSDSQKIALIKEAVEKKSTAWLPETCIKEVKEILYDVAEKKKELTKLVAGESPSNQECTCWKSEESGAVYYAGCPIHRRDPKNNKDKECECCKDSECGSPHDCSFRCVKICPIHRSKKNNTKECYCPEGDYEGPNCIPVEKCPVHKCFCYKTGQTCTSPKCINKKEERCTCYPKCDCPKHGIKGCKCWNYPITVAFDCLVHPLDGEPKLPSERIRKVSDKEPGVWEKRYIEAILKYLDSQHEADK